LILTLRTKRDARSTGCKAVTVTVPHMPRTYTTTFKSLCTCDQTFCNSQLTTPQRPRPGTCTAQPHHLPANPSLVISNLNSPLQITSDIICIYKQNVRHYSIRFAIHSRLTTPQTPRPGRAHRHHLYTNPNSEMLISTSPSRVKIMSEPLVITN
jgi:hypothetical protein